MEEKESNKNVLIFSGICDTIFPVLIFKNTKGVHMDGETTVGKKEVLKELGHPATWGRSARMVELQHRIRPGEKDLDIAGIRGYPSAEGYLEYLEKSIASPPGTGTSLVSREEDRKILDAETKEIAAEIAKYRVRLAILERIPDEVDSYLNHLRWVMRQHRAFGIGVNDIEKIKQRIVRYESILTELRSRGVQ